MSGYIFRTSFVDMIELVGNYLLNLYVAGSNPDAPILKLMKFIISILVYILIFEIHKVYMVQWYSNLFLNSCAWVRIPLMVLILRYSFIL